MKYTAACLVALCLLPASLAHYKPKKVVKPKDVCHTIWEEVVTPRCKTTYEEVGQVHMDFPIVDISPLNCSPLNYSPSSTPPLKWSGWRFVL